jgi:pimeloyl-ACP methyl ester carboxylesterase
MTVSSASSLTETHVATSHGRLRVLVRPGNGPAMMLLHGNSFSGDVFVRLAASKALAGIPLIIPDLPGHGGSDNAASPAITYSTSGLAACMHELAETLHLTAYTVFGWSLGGQVAIEMLDHAPGLIGVAACGAAVVQRGPLGMISGFHISRDLLLAGKGEMSDGDARRFSTACIGNDSQAETVLCTDPALRPALSRATLLGKGRDQRAAIAEAQTPVCLMLGVNDPFIRADSLQKVSGPTLFGGRCLMLKDAGHAPFLDAPHAFDPALASFHAHAVRVAECFDNAHVEERRKAA